MTGVLSFLCSDGCLERLPTLPSFGEMDAVSASTVCMHAILLAQTSAVVAAASGERVGRLIRHQLSRSTCGCHSFSLARMLWRGLDKRDG